MKWRPMKTAPKDGTSIILQIEDSAIEGRYEAQPARWTPISLGWHGCGCCGDSLPEPTGWIPLPV